MECKTVDNVGDDKEQFLAISASFGLYKDISNLIYSYMYEFIDYDVIYKDSNVYWYNVKRISNSMFHANDFSDYCLYVIQDSKIIKIRPNIRIYNESLIIFECNSEIFAIDRASIYKVIIDYDSLTYNLQFMYVNFIPNRSMVVFKEKLIEINQKHVYSISLTDVVKGSSVIEVTKFISIPKNNKDIDKYIGNNLDKIISIKYHKLNLRKAKHSRKPRWIYRFIKDNAYYEYYSNICLLHDGCQCAFNNYEEYIGLSNSTSIININKCLYFRPISQERYIKLKDANIVYFTMINFDTAVIYIHAMGFEGPSLKVIRLH